MNPPPSPPSADLSAAISALDSLLQLSISAVQSLPILISTTGLLRCPFNCNHRIPPSSLFSHYLNCPNPASLSSPNYSHTLNSTAAPSPSSPLSFSLESYIDNNTPANNFFYQNCPATVTTPIRPPPLLTVPRVLYLECDKDPQPLGFPVSSIKFLPSEIWAIRCEIDTWDGSSNAGGFSIRILRAILRLRDCKLSRLQEWVVASSPKYGVIIDFAMRDHVVLLVRFCLKAIVREAFGLVGYLFSGEELNVEGMLLLSELSTHSFQCPVLGEGLMWLISQFGLLYGEVNAKFFVVDMLKECIVESASDASLFPLKDNNADLESVYCELKEPAERSLAVDVCKQNEGESMGGQTVGGSVISISQVAAAVAALHERSLIEEKIRAFRNSRQLSVYQRNVEHACVSKMADEERKKRPNYRPIIEHDGLLWQRSRNQESNKMKTKEELLAEERDYKRRRMSYRGKKLKRNSLEVTRGIIEEYMEEIKQSGGIGSMSKAAEGLESSASDNLHKHESSSGVSGARRTPEISEDNGDTLHDYRKKRSSCYDSKDLENDIEHRRRESSLEHELRDSNRNVKRARHVTDDYSESRDGRQSGGHSKGQHIREREDSVEGGYSRRSRRSGSKSHEENYHKRERYGPEHYSSGRERNGRGRDSHERGRDRDSKESRDRGRSKGDINYRKRDEEEDGHRDRWKSKRNRTDSSHSEVYNEFEDRYDPAESHSSYDA